MSKPHYPTRTDARLTSPFGWRIHPISKRRVFHFGIDLAPKVAGTRGLPVYAVRDGVVTERFFNSARGNTLRIKHDDENISTGYQHLDLVANNGMLVQVGQKVKAGQRIGTMGTTGGSTGIHLHFEVITGRNFTQQQGPYLDPKRYLDTPVPQKVTVSTNGLQYFADQVKRGAYGNGHARREAHIYNLVRDRVNGRGRPGPFEDVVRDVKRGVYGNGHTNRSSQIYQQVRELVNR